MTVKRDSELSFFLLTVPFAEVCGKAIAGLLPHTAPLGGWWYYRLPQTRS